MIWPPGQSALGQAAYGSTSAIQALCVPCSRGQMCVGCLAQGRNRGVRLSVLLISTLLLPLLHATISGPWWPNSLSTSPTLEGTTYACPHQRLLDLGQGANEAPCMGSPEEERGRR